MTLAIIPARGGSKRIPRKNIKLFNGKPMIAHSILVAQQSGCFERIIVSTDDAEIAQIAQQYGAEVPFTRPAELSDDFATTGAVIAHAIDYMQKHGNWHGNMACCIYATAPFIQIQDLQNGAIKLREMGVDFAFSVTEYAFPIQRALKLDAAGEVAMWQPEMFAVRSQDLATAWHDAGQFYWGTSTAWLAQKPIFNSKSVGVKLPRYRVQDIDTIGDWEYAELMAKVLLEWNE
ncbi:pseudaminic acid cytidylyltransferase [Wielerella bovis]|uniref:pseudaminic acid cytidylyltransferase n=1 Tax=Wielerella bovis TaxID=2917790 RepID=UPI002018CED1|nr:pseudaminic acid cytidylyltransferase [Wielerella bovis]ULJ63513.1 pseudaminic acid cytidylyltransferase [Wielerella bovis]ULJ65678.1 pseudaminic acid cytidylyltransferase [Wielerella bovis]ULJ66279.1 pseudaminic acid cytidylyltransferase [Wielerella bovis]